MIRKYFINKNYVLVTIVLGMLYVTLSSDIDGPAHHGHGNVTGATTGATGHCQTSTCHGGNNANTIVLLQVIDTSTMLPITVYNSSQTYEVLLTGDATAISTTLPGFGFQVSAVLGSHAQGGTFSIPASLTGSIHTYPCGTTTIVEHSEVLAPITAGTNKYSIQFYWTAPTPGSDSVSFYSLLNAVNGDGGDGGDYPNAGPRVTIYENPTEKVTPVNVSTTDLSIYPNPAYGNPTISYNLALPATVSVDVHDITGKTIAVMADNELQNSGLHQYHPAITAPGLYIVHMVSGGISATRMFVNK